MLLTQNTDKLSVVLEPNDKCVFAVETNFIKSRWIPDFLNGVQSTDIRYIC